MQLIHHDAGMKVQVKVGPKWRDADATIDANGHAVIQLPHPYGKRIFKEWRKLPRKAKK